VKIEESKGTASEKGAVPFDFSKILKKMIFQSIEKSMVLLANACKYGVCERFYKNI